MNRCPHCRRDLINGTCHYIADHPKYEIYRKFKVISGGQIGADIAALRAAKKLGIETGGWMPKGFRTKEGGKWEYADEYSMKETSTRDYPTRTGLNVAESDGTLRFAYNWNSRGERATLRCLQKYEKPYYNILRELHGIYVAMEG